MNVVGKSRLEFDLSRPPGLGKPRLQQAVEAQDGIPVVLVVSLLPPYWSVSHLSLKKNTSKLCCKAG